MSRVILVVFIAMIILPIQSGISAGAAPSADMCSDWMNKRLNQTDANTCAAKDAENERARLQRLLQDLRRKFIASRQEGQWLRLETLEKEWEQFARNDCNWETGFSDGASMQPVINSLCMANATANRVERLRIFLCDKAGAAGECKEARAYEMKTDGGRR
jgi:uncharacterized protein YecT (DUF1311 family)